MTFIRIEKKRVVVERLAGVGVTTATRVICVFVVVGLFARASSSIFGIKGTEILNVADESSTS